MAVVRADASPRCPVRVGRPLLIPLQYSSVLLSCHAAVRCRVRGVCSVCVRGVRVVG